MDALSGELFGRLLEQRSLPASYRRPHIGLDKAGAHAVHSDPVGGMSQEIRAMPALGRVAKQNLTEFESNRTALRVVCEALSSPGFYDPFIMGKNSADLIWDRQDLRRECERRKIGPAALAAVADYPVNTPRCSCATAPGC
jgi:hypothetical protein